MTENFKFIGDVEHEKFSLEVVECECGFHLGVDATYLEHCDDIEIICPSCSNHLFIKSYK